MKDGWLDFTHVFDGEVLLPDTSVRVEDGYIAEISDEVVGGARAGACLTPGFVDLQVNGGGGVLLNASPTPDGINAIAAAHRAFGTVALLPTVITDAPEVLDQAAAAVLAAKDQPGILGLHIEGPHISVARRGTHSAEFIRPFSEHTLSIVQKLRASGVSVMVTLAPEEVSPADIAALSATGAVVSLGHTNATAEQIAQAKAAGARSATHLFNAMSQMTSRAPGAVGGILHEQLPFGIICDGHHVDDRMVALALKAGPGFLVSDAMATVGGPDSFDLYGQTISVEDGRLINAEGNLAGAHFTQAEGVQRLVRHIGVPLEQALRMVVTIPSQVIGRPDLARLVGRPLSETVVLDDALQVSKARS